MGISRDEWHRGKDSRIPYIINTYPYLDRRLGRWLDRNDCYAIIAQAGIAIPDPSSCWFCPLHRRSRWQDMATTTPALFVQAVDLERFVNTRRGALGKDPVWFSSALVPLDQSLTMSPSPLVLPCASGYCGCRGNDDRIDYREHLAKGPWNLIIADVPWRYSQPHSNGKARHLVSYPMLEVSEYAEMMRHCYASLQPNCNMWCWTDHYNLFPLFKAAEQAGFTYRGLAIVRRKALWLGRFMRQNIYFLPGHLARSLGLCHFR